MSIRKTTISSYFVAPGPSSNVKNSKNVHEEDVNDLSDSLTQSADWNNDTEFDDIESTSGNIDCERSKRKDPPEFEGVAIMKKKSTHACGVVLSSIEETHLPEMSVRAKKREEKILAGTVRSEKLPGQSRAEIQLRINDKANLGHLITEQADGLIRLWCRYCHKVVCESE